MVKLIINDLRTRDKVYRHLHIIAVDDDKCVFDGLLFTPKFTNKIVIS